jgi:N6-L-threonylcarbamoyladenine synthase
LEDEPPPFPFVALTVSGGHTSLFIVKGFGDYAQLGQTLDDAAGEAFDKVAKILGLGYPGGAPIEKLARSGNREGIQFPRAFLSPRSLDFSFSGLKTSVSLYVNKWRQENKTGIKMEDIAASFQEAVIEVLAQKLIKAKDRMNVKAVVIAGGVACNGALREKLAGMALEDGMGFYYPRPAYCTDNGAMIAVAGFHRLMNGERVDLSIDVRSRFPIEDLHRMTSNQP